MTCQGVLAGSVGQYALACHLLVVRRDRARLDVRSTGGALERRLQTATDHPGRGGRIAADSVGTPVRSSRERHNIGVAGWLVARLPPCDQRAHPHRTIDPDIA